MLFPLSYDAANSDAQSLVDLLVRENVRDTVPADVTRHLVKHGKLPTWCEITRSRSALCRIPSTAHMRLSVAGGLAKS